MGHGNLLGGLQIEESLINILEQVSMSSFQLNKSTKEHVIWCFSYPEMGFANDRVLNVLNNKNGIYLRSSASKSQISLNKFWHFRHWFWLKVMSSLRILSLQDDSWTPIFIYLMNVLDTNSYSSSELWVGFKNSYYGFTWIWL